MSGTQFAQVTVIVCSSVRLRKRGLFAISGATSISVPAGCCSRLRSAGSCAVAVSASAPNRCRRRDPERALKKATIVELDELLGNRKVVDGAP